MNTILKEFIQKGFCLVYLDDIIIMFKDPESHALHLDAVLSALHKHNLFCQLPKCFWAKTEIKYLGHLVSGTGVLPDPSKVSALDNWEYPSQLVTELQDVNTASAQRAVSRKKLVHECRRYVGFMNYFSRFIPRYSALAACLQDQTKDNAPEWSPQCTSAWNALRTCLRNATLMYHPDQDDEVMTSLWPFMCTLMHPYGALEVCWCSM